MRDATIVDCYEYFQWLTLHHSTSKVVWVIFAGNMPSCRLWPFHLPALRDPTANNDNFNEVLCTIYFPIKRWVYVQGSQDEKWFVFRCVLLHATVFFFSDTPTGERGYADKSPSWSRSNSSVKKPWECHQFEAACSISKMNVHWNRYSHSTKIQSNQECPNKSRNMGNYHRSK